MIAVRADELVVERLCQVVVLPGGQTGMVGDVLLDVDQRAATTQADIGEPQRLDRPIQVASRLLEMLVGIHRPTEPSIHMTFSSVASPSLLKASTNLRARSC